MLYLCFIDNSYQKYLRWDDITEYERKGHSVRILDSVSF